MASIPSLQCPVCGATTFTRTPVLWDELVAAWELSSDQRACINDQQGLACATCKCALRSMTLAYAIMRRLGTNRLFGSLCESDLLLHSLRVLEINEAGNLSPFLRKLPKYFFAAYPEYDMQNLPFPEGSFDVIIHSDTLEHIPDSVLALKECRRILTRTGFMAYTIPIIPDRLTRSRSGLEPSYHGRKVVDQEAYLVHREYGGDFWRELFEADFSGYAQYTILYPASVAIIAEP